MLLGSTYLAIRQLIPKIAKRLNEELHEPFTNEQRWEIIEKYLNTLYDATYEEGKLDEASGARIQRFIDSLPQAALPQADGHSSPDGAMESIEPSEGSDLGSNPG